MSILLALQGAPPAVPDLILVVEVPLDDLGEDENEALAALLVDDWIPVQEFEIDAGGDDDEIFLSLFSIYEDAVAAADLAWMLSLEAEDADADDDYNLDGWNFIVDDAVIAAEVSEWIIRMRRKRGR